MAPEEVDMKQGMRNLQTKKEQLEVEEETGKYASKA